jgi:hypothetical protein
MSFLEDATPPDAGKVHSLNSPQAGKEGGWPAAAMLGHGDVKIAALDLARPLPQHEVLEGIGACRALTISAAPPLHSERSGLATANKVARQGEPQTIKPVSR